MNILKLEASEELNELLGAAAARGLEATITRPNKKGARFVRLIDPELAAQQAADHVDGECRPVIWGVVAEYRLMGSRVLPNRAAASSRIQFDI